MSIVREPGPPVSPSNPTRSNAPRLIVAVFLLGGVAGLVLLEGRYRAQGREMSTLQDERDAAVERERELSEAVARSYRRLTKAEDELEALRFQFEAVEMQLDGVDYLSRSLRQELDLPPEPFGEEADSASPIGGSLPSESNMSARIETARVRLARGLSELYSLGEHIVARRVADQADSASASSEPSAVETSGDTAPESPPLRVMEPPANWPARGSVTSDFGWRMFGGRRNFHTGIDISLPRRSQVLSTSTGTVVGSGWQPGYGWCVLVQHVAGYNTLYAHLAEPLVQVGDPVVSGTLVGLSGSSGNSTGPHLHYEVWKDGRVLDPRPLMDGTGGAGGG